MQKQKSSTAILLLLCFYCIGTAQDLRLSFHHLSSEEGLSHAQTHLVYQDSYGFVWIGTEEGLNRFDGQYVAHFSPASSGFSSGNVSSRCFEDPDKNLWFSTDAELVCYRRATGRFESFRPPLQDVTDLIAFYLDLEGRFWVKAGVGEQGSLYLFDTQSHQYRRLGPLQGACFEVVVDANKRVAQVVAGKLPNGAGGITLTDVHTWKTDTIKFDQTAYGEIRRYSSPVKNMLVEGDSVIWVGVYDGLGKYNIQQRKSVALLDRTSSVESNFGWVFDIAAFDKNRLLAACGDGLKVFDKRQNKFVQEFCHQPKLPGAIREGEAREVYYNHTTDNLWLSGPGGGLAFAHLAKSKFTALPALVGSAISALFKDKNGRIWCSTVDSGVYVFNQFYQKLFQTNTLGSASRPNETATLNEFSSFWEDGASGLWGFSFNYAFYWNKNPPRFESRDENFFGLASSAADHVKANCLLPNGTRLIAQGKQIFSVNINQNKVALLPWLDTKDLHLQEVTAIFQSKKGLLFLADNHYRLLVADLSQGHIRPLATIKDVGDCTDFIETDDGFVWAATSKGLFCFPPDNIEGKLLTAKTDGLPNEQYYDIIPDRLGYLWLTGNNGLIRYDRRNQTHHRFGTGDGLLSNEFSRNAALYVQETGAIWLGSKNGVNVFRPEDIRLLDFKPNIELTRFWVNDDNFNVDMDLCLLKRLELDYTSNTLSFQFAALDYSAPSQNQYYYRMRGIEKDSVFNGTRNFVRYANLPPGEYTFEVWATNSDGLLSPEPRRLQIFIRPPFWQTWWFYLLCTLTLASLVYGWFWYRLQQVLRIERMRVQISSDLHDDVGTLLAGLAMQSEALEISAPEKDKGKLRRISEISRNAMAHMRDTVWAIDARKDKVENLLDRMREHAEETLTPKDLRFELSVDNVSLKQNLSTQIRQALYLIYKEAVTNAAKHTNGDTVSVSLKKMDKGLEMRIYDNGKVQEKAYKTTGLGTSNMQMRAEKIGATLEITRDNGFCVTLRLLKFTG